MFVSYISLVFEKISIQRLKIAHAFKTILSGHFMNVSFLLNDIYRISKHISYK